MQIKLVKTAFWYVFGVRKYQLKVKGKFLYPHEKIILFASNNFIETQNRPWTTMLAVQITYKLIINTKVHRSCNLAAETIKIVIGQHKIKTSYTKLLVRPFYCNVMYT